VLVCHALGVFAQAVFAGQFLSGSDSQVRLHELTGWAVFGLSILQILLAALLLRSQNSSLWLVFGSIFVFLAEGLQMGTGYGRFLSVHIPLGVVVVAVVSWQAISVFLKRAPSAMHGNEA